MFLPQNVYIAWDKKICWPSTNFRKTIMEGTYKGTRIKTDNGLYTQEAIIGEITSSLGVKNMYPYVLEADDIISWLSTKISPNTIISVDQDLLQLINENTQFYHLNKKIVINKSNFEEHTNVPLNAYLYYKVILGDQSDNIKGFPGFGKVRGKKMACDIALHNGDIKNVNLSPEYITIYEQNLKLMDLKLGYTLEKDEVYHYERQFGELEKHQPNFDHFEEMIKQMDIKSIYKDIDEWKAVFDLHSSNNVNILNMLS